MTRVTVLSFNIWVNGGRSLTNCIEVIRSTGADLVGLQECDDATARTIGRALGFHVFAANDCSMVSRWPLVGSNVVGNSRGITVEPSPGQRLHLFNCHLPPYPYGPYSLRDGASLAAVVGQEQSTRMPALNALLAAMRPFLAGPDPCFLTGDFDVPSHLDYETVPWPNSIAVAQAGMEDAYRELHPGNRKFPRPFAFDEPGITWSPENEAGDVFDRIDFVYYSQGDGLTVVRSTELDGRNSVTPWPSDHRAVLGVFDVVPFAAVTNVSRPSPTARATNVSLFPVLEWQPAAVTGGQQVYFGDTPMMMWRTNTTNATYAPGRLQPGKTYYWRIDTVTPEGTNTGPVWSFTTASVSVREYEWNFARSDLTPAMGRGVMTYTDATTANQTMFGRSDGVSVPHIGGVPTPLMTVPPLPGGESGYHVTLRNSAPNGGGSYINQFTFLMDLFIPAPLVWVPLFNTNPTNGNEAEFWVSPGGAVGVGELGFTVGGKVVAQRWHRLVFSADLPAGVVSYYVDGALVRRRTGEPLRDGRFSIYSDANAGPDLLLFNSANPASRLAHPIIVSTLAFTDRVMNEAEIAALGAPTAGGIFAPDPLRLAITRAGDRVQLTWSGGRGPFRLERSLGLDSPIWQEMGPASVDRVYFAEIQETVAFYRVTGE